MFNEKTFQSVYRDRLAELYDAEVQMAEAMPKIIRAAWSPELKTAFELHLAETKEQAARLEAIIADLDGPMPRQTSEAMRSMLAKSKLATVWHEPSPVLDEALIGTAQQIEAYEIASYGAALLMARMLNFERAATLLRKSLKEEQDTGVDLGQIAESIMMGEELEDAVLAEA